MQRVGLRLPDNLHSALRRAAFEAGVSMNAMILDAIAAKKEVRAELERGK